MFSFFLKINYEIIPLFLGRVAAINIHDQIVNVTAVAIID